MSSSVERSDETFTRWMRDNLARAASHFGLTVRTEPLSGWALRSLCAPARTENGEPRWLRVCSERTRWVREMGEFWTGNVDADVIDGVRKPRVLGWFEWEAPAEARSVRAEVMTFLPGVPCSRTDVLHFPIELPDSWWEDLCLALATLRTVHTDRFASAGARRVNRVRQIFGDKVADAMRPRRWETAHGDLHWNNVFGPEFAVIDWEFWGRAPAGTDAATLYAYALPVPQIANRVHEVFHDELDSHDGRIALLGVASRILHRANNGEYDDVAQPIRDLATEILAKERLEER